MLTELLQKGGSLWPLGEGEGEKPYRSGTENEHLNYPVSGGEGVEVLGVFSTFILSMSTRSTLSFPLSKRGN